MGPHIYFEILGGIERTEIIAVGAQIRHLDGLVEQYGKGRWSKLKGVAMVRMPDGTIRTAEIHWYEAHGIGKRRFKIKRFID